MTARPDTSDTASARSDTPHGWLQTWTTGRRAYFTGILIGLAEAVFPFITPEVFLIPMLAAARQRIWLLALSPVIGNLIAALLLYAAGAALAGPVIEPLVGWMGGDAEYQRAIDWLNKDGFLAIFLLDLVPIPVQIVLLAAGVAGLSLPLFLLAIALSRSARYLLIAAIVVLVGDRARSWLQRHQVQIFLAGLALSVALGLWMVLA